MALDNFESIERISAQDTRIFQHEFYSKSTPVIVEGMCDLYPARRKWTTGFFKSGLGNIQVGVFEGSKTKTLMRFGDYLDILESDYPADYTLHGFNIFKYQKDLRNDFGSPSLIMKYLKWVSKLKFGCRNSSFSLKQNQAPVDFFHNQLQGEKQVILFHPQYSNLLYKLPLSRASAANIDYPNYYKFPGLQFVKGMSCNLQPGDTLFVPMGYWHHSRYLHSGFGLNQKAISVNAASLATRMWNDMLLPSIDSGLSHLIGDKWQAYKNSMSRKRANSEYYQISVERKFKNILPASDKSKAILVP